jgi:GMP synthase (glutamine-hydrolysing)
MTKTAKRTIGILEAGPVNPVLRERHGGHGDFFRAWLGPRAPDTAFPIWKAYEGALPEAPESCDAYLVTGSRFSTYDPLPWIAPLKAFIREAAETRPVVGICFGHQIIAEAFGGRIEKSERGWGIGVHRYRLLEEQPWMSPALETISLIVSHQDQVVEPPPEARVLASSEFCPIAMMQIGENVLTLQAHPEATVAYSSELYAGRRESLGAVATDAAIESLSLARDEEPVARWLLAFLNRPHTSAAA